jgi:predicted phage baseplate assembly protein
VRWREADSFAGLSPTQRRFVTTTDDAGKTRVVFANGEAGARLPTGIENLKAVYRRGIGKPGNVRAGQISLLSTRPLGVKEVINPLRASGGANREGRDQARVNAPLAVKALDRLVSTRDYQDFARTFAGLGKAYATELTDGRRSVVHVTIAGAEDIPIDDESELVLNLRRALRDFGDAFLPVIVARRALLLLVVSARLRILEDYLWESVVTAARRALLDAFGFERRELGQDVARSEITSVMQAVPGVAYVDLDALGALPETVPGDDGERLQTPEEIADAVEAILTRELTNNRPIARVLARVAEFTGLKVRPAEIAVLSPDVPATLVLNQLT